jgi:hypothetical protein
VAEVVEHLLHDRRIGDEGNDPHVRAALGTEQRVDLVDPADGLCPATSPSGLAILVPEEMKGLYPNATARALYSNHRRFTVETQEAIGLGE